MNVASLRFRLTAWYFVTVSAICTAAGASYWFGVRAALDNALDQGLRYRLIGLREVLADTSDDDAIAMKLVEMSRLGELYQVFDANGTLIARSDGLARHDVPSRPPGGVSENIGYSDGGTNEFPLRVASQRVAIHNRTLVLGAADPRRKFDGVQETFTNVLLLSAPIVLLAASACGLWLGRRALSPVARIAAEARAIDEDNLSSRLPVPDSRDELQLLSETLNEMLNRLERSFGRMRQFTGDASHELRAPVTLIRTAAEFAVRRERRHDELLETLHKILSEAERMTGVIDDLLALARGDQSRDAPAVVRFDAVPMLREVADQATQLAAPKEITVRLAVTGSTLPVLADEALVRRIMSILIDNAIRYTAAAGTVTISGHADGGVVSLCVTDNGPGIATGDLEHVFERFWRADRVRTREAGGSGLGLAIARQLAERQGAEIQVESTVGRGSAFRLVLAQQNVAFPARLGQAAAS